MVERSGELEGARREAGTMMRATDEGPTTRGEWSRGTSLQQVVLRQTGGGMWFVAVTSQAGDAEGK